MTTNVTALVESKFAITVDTDEYISDSVVTAIDKFTARNTSDTITSTLYINLVPAGGALGVENQFSKVLFPGQEWSFPNIVGHVLKDGDKISVRAEHHMTLAFRVSGRQFSL